MIYLPQSDSFPLGSSKTDWTLFHTSLMLSNRSCSLLQCVQVKFGAQRSCLIAKLVLKGPLESNWVALFSFFSTTMKTHSGWMDITSRSYDASEYAVNCLFEVFFFLLKFEKINPLTWREAENDHNEENSREFWVQLFIYIRTQNFKRRKNYSNSLRQSLSRQQIYVTKWRVADQCNNNCNKRLRSTFWYKGV